MPRVDPDDRVRTQAALESILQTSLDFGVQVQISGGNTARVRESMEHVALRLGAEQSHTWVSPGGIGMSVSREGVSQSSVLTTPTTGVNFTELSELARLSREAEALTPAAIREQLDQIKATKRAYPMPLTIAALGIACGAFAGIFGADLAGITIAAVGGASGALLRYWLMKRHFKPFIYCLFSSFISVSIVLGLHRLTGFAATVDQAAVASILYLVPGVPMLNGTADLLTSNYLNGVAGLTRATVMLVGTALGFTMGFLVWGYA